MNTSRNIFYIGLMVMTMASCSSQRYVSSETDDIYFSSEDRFSEEKGEFATVTPVEGSDFIAENEQAASDDGGYFMKGSAKSADDQNPYSEQAYADNYPDGAGVAFDGSTTSTDGNTTINNFYGTTNYYEKEYYNDSYATRLRRFNSANVAMGYGYYDPFFVDPYWNYGWSYWNPYPVGGWNIGWNSWSGWSVGYNWGWGRPGWGWGRPGWGGHWGYCDPYWGWVGPYGWGGSPYYGWGGYGWGNGYWAGYNNGYWNGLNDGLWLGGTSARRAYVTARRGLATEGGFANTRGGGVSSPNGSASSESLVGKSINSVGRSENPFDSRDKLGSPTAGSELLADKSKLYQSSGSIESANRSFSKMERKDVESAAVERNLNKPISGDQNLVSKNKYEASKLTRTSREQLTTINRAQERSTLVNGRSDQGTSNSRINPDQNRNYSTPKDRSVNTNRYYQPNQNGRSIDRNNGSVSQPNNSSRSNIGTRTTSPTRTVPSKSNSNVRQSTSPSTRTQPSRNVSSPSRSSSSPSRNFSFPSRSSSSPSRSFSTPSRSSSSPSRSFSSPSSGSSSRMSSPSRSGGRR